MTAAPLELAVVEHEDELAALAGWDDLVRGAPRPSPFLLHGWLVEWWRHFGEGRTLAVAVAKREGRLVGAAPVYVARSRGVRVARFLGAHESSLGDLLLAAGEERKTGRLLVDELLEQPFDYADLYGLPADSALAASAEPRFVERVDAPVLQLPDGWEAA